MQVIEIYNFPVKSMAPQSTRFSEVTPRGLVQDRRWMVVDAKDRFVTGRFIPQLVTCTATVRGQFLVLERGGASIQVPFPDANARLREVAVWRDSVHALDAGDAVADWLEVQFGRALRLVYQAEDHHRWLPAEKARQPSDEVSFADGYPLLLIGTASLEELNSRLERPVSMQHFRPNVVIQTSVPFIEDSWSLVQLGAVRFELASRCSRCIFTTVEPDSGEKRADGEPLRTLRQYRTVEAEGGIMFGMNAIPRSTGVIRVNDEVTPTD